MTKDTGGAGTNMDRDRGESLLVEEMHNSEEVCEFD